MARVGPQGWGWGSDECWGDHEQHVGEGEAHLEQHGQVVDRDESVRVAIAERLAARQQRLPKEGFGVVERTL
eukprot:6617699-Prymnesium_polylepis.1